MATRAKIELEKRRQKTVKRFAVRRKEIKDKLSAIAKELTRIKEGTREAADIQVLLQDQDELTAALQKLPRDSSQCRLQRRCRLCGRPHAVVRRTGLCRIHMRMAVMQGLVPGMRKGSW